MVPHFLESVTAYTVSIGMHTALLAVLIINLQYTPPKPDPIVRATVYFEQPEPVVQSKAGARKKKKVIKKVNTKTEPDRITKPTIKNPDKTQFHVKSPATGHQLFTTNNELKIKGFLRANDFTRKKALPSPPTQEKSDHLELPSLPRQKTEPLALNPIAPASVAQKTHKRTSVEMPVPENTNTNLSEKELHSGLRSLDASIFSRNWRKQSEIKTHRKSIAFQVSSNWTIPPIAISEFEILVEVHIDKRGAIAQFKFVKPADLAILNVAAERAVKLSEPFDSLPGSIETDQDTYKVVLRFVSDNTAN